MGSSPARSCRRSHTWRRGPDLAGPGHLCRSCGQVGSISTAYLAPRCYGGPNPGQRPDPRGHHGRRRRFSGGQVLPGLRALSRRDDCRGFGGRIYRRFRGVYGPGDERHQACDGLLHDQSTRLHDGGPGTGSVCAGNIPSGDSRGLQGASLPWGRQC